MIMKVKEGVEVDQRARVKKVVKKKLKALEGRVKVKVEERVLRK